MFPTKQPQGKIPDRKTRTKIAARADVDERTVHRFFSGVSNPIPTTRRAILEAARNLGVDVEEWS